MKEKNAVTNQGNIGSIDKAFAIIDFLYQEGEEASLNDISKGLSMNKSTTYRILNAVKSAGYIYKNEETANYGLTSRFYQIGLRIQNGSNFLGAYAQYARELNEKYNEVVTVSVRELEVNDIPRYMVVYGFKDRHSLSLRFQAGVYTEAHCTASGKCLLAFSQERYLNKFRGCKLRKHTDFTITDWDKLEEELQGIRESGYAVDREESELGLNGIATPIFAPNGKIVGALSFTLPSERYKRLNIMEVISDMKKISGLRLEI